MRRRRGRKFSRRGGRPMRVFSRRRRGRAGRRGMRTRIGFRM